MRISLPSILPIGAFVAAAGDVVPAMAPDSQVHVLIEQGCDRPPFRWSLSPDRVACDVMFRCRHPWVDRLWRRSGSSQETLSVNSIPTRLAARRI